MQLNLDVHWEKGQSSRKGPLAGERQTDIQRPSTGVTAASVLNVHITLSVPNHLTLVGHRRPPSGSSGWVGRGGPEHGALQEERLDQASGKARARAEKDPPSGHSVGQGREEDRVRARRRAARRTTGRSLFQTENIDVKRKARSVNPAGALFYL